MHPKTNSGVFGRFRPVTKPVGFGSVFFGCLFSGKNTKILGVFGIQIFFGQHNSGTFGYSLAQSDAIFFGTFLFGTANFSGKMNFGQNFFWNIPFSGVLNLGHALFSDRFYFRYCTFLQDSIFGRFNFVSCIIFGPHLFVVHIFGTIQYNIVPNICTMQE